MKSTAGDVHRSSCFAIESSFEPGALLIATQAWPAPAVPPGNIPLHNSKSPLPFSTPSQCPRLRRDGQYTSVRAHVRV